MPKYFVLTTQNESVRDLHGNKRVTYKDGYNDISKELGKNLAYKYSTAEDIIIEESSHWVREAILPEGANVTRKDNYATTDKIILAERIDLRLPSTWSYLVKNGYPKEKISKLLELSVHYYDYYQYVEDTYSLTTQYLTTQFHKELEPEEMKDFREDFIIYLIELRNSRFTKSLKQLDVPFNIYVKPFLQEEPTEIATCVHQYHSEGTYTDSILLILENEELDKEVIIYLLKLLVFMNILHSTVPLQDVKDAIEKYNPLDNEEDYIAYSKKRILLSEYSTISKIEKLKELIEVGWYDPIKDSLRREASYNSDINLILAIDSISYEYNKVIKDKINSLLEDITPETNTEKTLLVLVQLLVNK